MRFTVEFEVGKNSFPVDYREIFVEYIAKLVCNGNKMSCTQDIKYSNKFTFAVYFRKPIFLENEIEIAERLVNLNFSCLDDELGKRLYAIFNRNKNKKYYFDEDNFLEPIFIKPVLEKKINVENVAFKILSPVLIEKTNDILENEKRKKHYYTFLDKEFEKFLKKSLNKAISEKEKELDFQDISFEVLDYRKTVVKHLGEKMTANLGKFRMKASKSLLNYIYRNGIGENTEMGFGMLEIL